MGPYIQVVVDLVQGDWGRGCEIAGSAAGPEMVAFKT